MAPSHILPNSHVLLNLPNQTSKLVRITPNSTINLGKFGSFPTNHLIYRPYHLTFDILDSPGTSGLRVVSTEELTRDLLGEQEADAAEEEEAGEDGEPNNSSGDADMNDAGLDDARNNRETMDDPTTQRLSWREIEELKRGGGSGREIISALMTSHSNIHQKTAYSLSKYTQRKRSKYLKRFSVVPVDVASILHYMLTEKEPPKVMEMRHEGLALMLSHANVRYCPDISVKYVDALGEVKEELRKGARWLVVDETGGLLVAAVAERLGLLEYEPKYLKSDDNDDPALGSGDEGLDSDDEEEELDEEVPAAVLFNDSEPNNSEPPSKRAKLSHSLLVVKSNRKIRRSSLPPPATSNTITLIHPNEQPNLSLLKFFSYDANTPPPAHPLYTHLRTLSYLSLLDPSSDPSLNPPSFVSESAFRSWKSGKKAAYLKKWRRWERMARTVCETRAGGFDGLLIASWMDVSGLLAYLVPLVRGSGQVVVWRGERESLVEVVDACGKERKGTWLRKKEQAFDAAATGHPPEQNVHTPILYSEGTIPVPDFFTTTLPALQALQSSTATPASIYLSPDSPPTTPQTNITEILTPTSFASLLPLSGAPQKQLDPTLLLAPTIHSTTARKYQVLPGRTHPVMTSKGGAEGYVLSATRVVPVEGRVEARGKGSLRRMKAAGKSKMEGGE